RECGAVNRVPSTRLGEGPLCGKCRKPLLSGRPVLAGDGDFARLVEKTDLPVVVDFWAPWCAPCRQFAPVFEQTAGQMATRASFVKLDTQDNPRTAARYRIRSIPTLMIFHRGREVARLSGALPQARFQQWLNEQLAGLQAA
ncbi:MAG TPA: thioredoxin TrxC, partial [Arenicellales bacterium]|nr:thioredoxin TrxC [Arenicellales bacterium]